MTLMKIWFTHNHQTLTTEDAHCSILPILDRNNRQHIVRWGATRADDRRFPRGKWYREQPLAKWGATWVRVPAIRYEQLSMYKGPLTIELDEPLAGALFRFPEAGIRVYLVESDSPGETTVTPLRFSQLTTPRNQ